MKSVVIFSGLILAIYLAVVWIKNDEENSSFLDRKHTNLLKGIAILTVVWGHATKMLGVNHIQVVAEVGVWIFLFCSGYGCFCSYEARGLTGFWRKRLTKVIIPFWICELVGLIVIGKFEIEKYLLDISFISPATSYGWFMGFILLYYIAFWISAKLCKTDRALNMSLQCFSAVAFIFFSTVSVNPLFPALKARQVLAFSAGVWTAMSAETIKSWLDKRYKTTLFAMVSVVIGGGMKLLTKWLESRTPYLVSNFTALLSVVLVSAGLILLSYMILRGPVRCVIDTQFFAKLGEYSFSLYMVHAFTLQILDGSITGSIAFLALTCVISLFVHWVFNELLPRLLRRKQDG